jgi:hypothetical protein
VALSPGEVIRHGQCDFNDGGRQLTKEQVYLRAELRDAQGVVLSRQTAFFTVPRFIEFADPQIAAEVRPAGDGMVEIALRAGSLAHMVCLGFGSHDLRLSDNWFDLHAGETRTIFARLPAEVGLDQVRAALQITSLWHSYQSCPPR